MMEIRRFATVGNATFGMLNVPGVPGLWTLEDLWRNNKRGESCIPAGTYQCKPHGWNGEKVRFTKVWEVMNVPGREAILLHAGNSDQDTLGCILVGMSINRGLLQGSRNALNLLRQAIGPHPFTLTVVDAISLPART